MSTVLFLVRTFCSEAAFAAATRFAFESILLQGAFCSKKHFASESISGSNLGSNCSPFLTGPFPTDPFLADPFLADPPLKDQSLYERQAIR
ncbi:hypothetical protein [Salinibacter ruber]|uniref:hypothetical protein n=1 Tax=Salinibacter ruber TaxID=146919 RepID=UPI0011AFC292|nr:hypothetical protein [Salinibacter ruber]